MPRYLVERTFPSDRIPLAGAGAEPDNVCVALIRTHAQAGVTWIHSYVTLERHRSYCICDAPSPEAIRVAGRASGLPVDRITEVRVLHPHWLR